MATPLNPISAVAATAHEEDQRGFAEKREILVSALDSSSLLVSNLQAFNQEKWTIRYPHQLGLSGPPMPRPVSRSTSPSPLVMRSNGMRRSASMSGEDFAEVENPLKAPSTRPSLPQRAYSTAETPIKASSSQLAPSPHPLSILSLDLKLGHPTAPTASLPALLPSLSLATLSQLLSRRLTSSLTHLTALRARVIDTSSRILVTGDLNAGKSTLVNALLRREVMPSDQQPCTTVFCEVLDAESHNDGKEEIHAIKDVEAYDSSNSSTFDSYTLDEVNSVQDDEAGRGYQLLKAYVTDARAPVALPPPTATPTDTNNPSFIKNGLVSISLIDAPGLNRDTLSTTALFARQAEIDVIVFVVSAENHFTLSAKEFLWNASREKAYVFIVVNKWKGIKDKDRCMRVVGEQIKQLSPATWDNRGELVHFVDAAEVLDDEIDNPSFEHLEQSLRSFVLLKRAKSKLTPAKHYLLNLLSDLSALSDSNVAAANVELQEALRQLEIIKPVHERLVAQRDEVEDGVDKVEEAAVELVRSSAWTRLESALGYIAQGQVAPQDADRVAFAGVESMEFPTQLPAYPGLLGVWSWAEEVKQTLVKSLEASVRAAEDDARVETVDGVKNVLTGLGDKYLPGTMVDGVEQHERVFRPEVMFAKRRRGVGKLAARGISTGLGLGSANVGASWTASEFEVTFIDLFNLERVYPSADATKPEKAIREDEGGELAAVSVVSVGVATLGMFGSRVVGVKGAVEGISSILEMLGSQAARRWAGPVVGIFSIGLAIFIVVDLPHAIPLNIGRKLVLSLSSPLAPLASLASTPVAPTSFATAHSDRISRETRKVLRLAGWDLRERFRAALEKSAVERREVEGRVGKDVEAIRWLDEFVERVRVEELRVDAIAL